MQNKLVNDDIHLLDMVMWLQWLEHGRWNIRLVDLWNIKNVAIRKFIRQWAKIQDMSLESSGLKVNQINTLIVILSQHNLFSPTSAKKLKFNSALQQKDLITITEYSADELQIKN